MSWSKIIAISTIALLVLGFVTINSVVAGEKVTWHGTSLMTESKQVEVGDVEGHVLAISKFQQLFINNKTGEKMASTSVGSMDMNPKLKQFQMTGYGWSVDNEGDKIFRTFDGQPIGQGQWKGTWKYVSGTGKFEGIKGSGTWTSYSMGEGQQSYMETEGDVEYPQQ